MVHNHPAVLYFCSLRTYKGFFNNFIADLIKNLDYLFTFYHRIISRLTP